MVITYKVQYIITSVKVSNRNDKYKYFKIVKIRVGVCIWNRPFQRKFRTRFELLKYRQLPSGSITWRRGLTLDSILGQSIIQIWSEEAYVCVSAAALCAFNVIPTTCVHCNQHVLCLYATPCSFPLCVYPCVCVSFPSYVSAHYVHPCMSIPLSLSTSAFEIMSNQRDSAWFDFFLRTPEYEYLLYQDSWMKLDFFFICWSVYRFTWIGNDHKYFVIIILPMYGYINTWITE